MSWKIIQADVVEGLREMPDGSVQCVVTSPPYWGLRDYGIEGQIGLEPTPEEYVRKMAAVFREVRRVLRDDGTLWLNMGDGMKDKQLVGMPWRLAFALQADGWWLRSDIIWSKPNPMPEAVTDRPTKAHEYLFLMTKAAKYFYDADAIRETPTGRTDPIEFGKPKERNDNEREYRKDGLKGCNRRTVWKIATEAYPDAHFATFPTKLVEPCIRAGTNEGDTVLDPFAGSGTTLLVADRLGRDGIGIELNQEYVEIARRRIRGDYPMFTEEIQERRTGR